MVSRAPTEGHGHVVEAKALVDKMVAEGKGAAEINKAVADHALKAVKSWLEKAGKAIQKLGPDHYLGGWVEKDKGGRPVALHLDVSQRFQERHKERAVKAGRERNQLAVWHVSKGEEIATGGTGR